jgi:hypothetical protein
VSRIRVEESDASGGGRKSLMTQKQRVALEAREAAQRDGKTLSAYAKERRLVIRELCDGLACHSVEPHAPQHAKPLK